MASVFLSYDREDGATARSIAQALEKGGHSVWWDRHIKGGAQYSKEIEAALARAEAVVVLWSEHSVDSAWVRDEAAAGRDTGRLVPVAIDQTEPPLGFRQYQTIDLSGGRLRKSRQQALLAAVDAVTGAILTEPPPRPARPLAIPPRATVLLAGLGLLLAVAAALLLSRPSAGPREVTVTVGPASADAASQALAREMAIKLGALQTSTATPVKLIEAQESDKADLAFEAASTGPASASLVLKSTKDSAILWSMEFEHPSGKRADLIQQVTYTAARITGCAMEGLEGPEPLKPAPLKAYLNACAQLSDMGAFNFKPPLPLLLEVIRAAPKFEPAWQALLLSEAELASPLANEAEDNRQAINDLRRHIAAARKVNATMPAADIAEIVLLPPSDVVNRFRRVEQAAERRPNDPVILSRLAGAMSAVGRQREAVRLAGRAVTLDPLSPLLQSQFTALVAYSGNFDAARRELAKAERLWPGTASLEDAQYRFHYRYGDPRIARTLFDKYNTTGGRGPRMLLDARLNPGPATIEPLVAFVRERLRNMENPSAGIGFATMAFATFDEADDFYSTLLNWPKADDIATISEVFFRPEFKEERRDPRFLQLAQRAGLLDYWRKSGDWPDFCFDPDQPYDCEAVAAKLARQS